MLVKNKCVTGLKRTWGPAYSRWPPLTLQTRTTVVVARRFEIGAVAREDKLKK